jgi:hypothetical protein
VGRDRGGASVSGSCTSDSKVKADSGCRTKPRPAVTKHGSGMIPCDPTSGLHNDVDRTYHRLYPAPFRPNIPQPHNRSPQSYECCYRNQSPGSGDQSTSYFGVMPHTATSSDCAQRLGAKSRSTLQKERHGFEQYLSPFKDDMFSHFLRGIFALFADRGQIYFT